jgi:hypothetical protein
MKIRFYHWMLYRLFHRVWSPIFASNTKLARHYAGMFTGWLDEMEGKNHHDCDGIKEKDKEKKSWKQF